jgi:hypothetical protein
VDKLNWTVAKGRTGSCSIQARSTDLLIKKGGIMKKIIITLACSVVAQLAFGQPNSTDKRQTTAEPVTVTGTIITTIEQGSAAMYQPSKTLIVNKDTPGRYVLDGPGHVLTKNGQVIRTAIKPGAHVQIYYANQGSLRGIDHVVVD